MERNTSYDLAHFLHREYPEAINSFRIQEQDNEQSVLKSCKQEG